MEAIFFLIDIIAVILLLYWSIINDRRGPDAPSTGLFAYRTATRRQNGKGAARRNPVSPTPRNR